MCRHNLWEIITKKNCYFCSCKNCGENPNVMLQIEKVYLHFYDNTLWSFYFKRLSFYNVNVQNKIFLLFQVEVKF